jgi:hypothetical protein
MITLQVLLIATVLGLVPVLGKLLRALMLLLAQLIAGALVVVFIMFLATVIASHGKWI